MKALIFAAGLGTRLKPFTLRQPKALVPVGGMPMLQRVILKLKEAGVEKMVVNVHHFSSQIIEFLAANRNFGIDIAVSDESDMLLDTGGGLLAAKSLLGEDEPVIVHNADIATDFDIAKMVEKHKESGADATLLVAERSTSRYLLMDEALRMRGWTNVKTSEVKFPAFGAGTCDPQKLRRLAFGGVHVVSPSIFPALEQYAGAEKVFPIMPFYIKECGDLLIQGYEPTGPYRWFDVGKPESLELAEAAFRKN